MGKKKAPKKVRKPRPNATTRGVGRPVLGAKSENGKVPRHEKFKK